MAAFMLENQDTSSVCQKNMFKVPCFVLEFFTSFLQYSLARFLLNDLLAQSSLASIRVCFSAMKANVRFVYPSPPLLNRLFHVALSTKQAYRVSFLYYSFTYTFPFCLLLLSSETCRLNNSSRMVSWLPRIGFHIFLFEKIVSQQARGLVETREDQHVLMMYSLNWNSPCVAYALCGRTCYSVIQWVATAFVVLCTSR